MTALLAFIFLSRTMTILQWVGLGLIVASVISMQMASLVQNRKRWRAISSVSPRQCWSCRYDCQALPKFV